jgi:hypothetical protein
MVQVDQSDSLRIVKDLTEASQTYRRQFVLWLGVGSAGGSVALLSFAANLPDPDFALHALLPALSAFAIGVIFAAGTILFLGKREDAAAFHHGEAFNRAETAKAINSIPEIISSPRSLAEGMNAERNKFVEKNRAAHLAAEAAWTSRSRFHVCYVACLTISSGGFLAGIIWPIAYIVLGGTFVVN